MPIPATEENRTTCGLYDDTRGKRSRSEQFRQPLSDAAGSEGGTVRPAGKLKTSALQAES